VGFAQLDRRKHERVCGREFDNRENYQGLDAEREYVTTGLRELGHSLDEKLARAMFDMNVCAVCQRYPDKLEIYEFGYVSEPLPTKIQLIKSLDCFLYQCSEGDAPERPLYKALDHIRLTLCGEYVSNTPEYDKAMWG